MSVLDLLLPDRRGIIPQEIRPIYSAHPRGHAAGRAQARGGSRVVPQTLEQAQASLPRFRPRARSSPTRWRANPHLPRGENVSATRGPKPFATAARKTSRPPCARQPPASPFPFLQCGDLWRMHCALNGRPLPRGARRRPGPGPRRCRPPRAAGHGPLRRCSRAQASRGRREGCQGLACLARRMAIPYRPCRGSPTRRWTPCHLDPRVTPDRRPACARSSGRSAAPSGRKTCFDPPDGRGEPLAAAVSFRLATPPYDLHCIERKSHMSVTLNNRDRNLLDAVLALRDDPSLGHEVYSERQAKRTSILRAFVPTRNALVYTPAANRFAWQVRIRFTTLPDVPKA